MRYSLLMTFVVVVVVGGEKGGIGLSGFSSLYRYQCVVLLMMVNFVGNFKFMNE